MHKTDGNAEIYRMAAVTDAIRLLAEQRPTMTLEAAGPALFKLVYAAAAAYEPTKLIAQAAAEALSADSVQKELPPW